MCGDDGDPSEVRKVEMKSDTNRGRVDPATDEEATQPSVSVILPTYGRAGYIGAAIRSILAQSVPLRDVVVVDDGSTDGTAEAVARFGDRVTYVYQENAGKLSAIDRGLNLIRGDLVWIMDDDDIAEPGAVAALRRPFAEDPDCVLSYGRMTRFQDGQEDAGRDVPVPYPVDDPRPFFAKILEDCFITGHPCVLVRRSALEALRPFQQGIIASVDYYLYLGIAQAGRSVFVDRQVLRQRQHGGVRGAAAHSYAESDRNARWAAQDRAMIAPLLDDLPLAAYTRAPLDIDGDGALSAPSQAAERRRALFQKAVIAARKKLWPQAFDAFRAAADIAPERPLDPAERFILTRALGCRYGIAEVHGDPEIPATLRDIAARRPDGSALLSALARPLLHEVKIARRERDPARVRDAMRTWRRLMPTGASAVAFGEVLTRAAAKLRSRVVGQSRGL